MKGRGDPTMARHCITCRRPRRKEIDRALIAEEPFRNLTLRYGISCASLSRHRTRHLRDLIAKSRAKAEQRERQHVAQLGACVRQHDRAEAAAADDLLTELRDCLRRIRLLSDGCDRWLR